MEELDLSKIDPDAVQELHDYYKEFGPEGWARLMAKNPGSVEHSVDMLRRAEDGIRKEIEKSDMLRICLEVRRLLRKDIANKINSRLEANNPESSESHSLGNILVTSGHWSFSAGN